MNQDKIVVVMGGTSFSVLPPFDDTILLRAQYDKRDRWGGAWTQKRIDHHVNDGRS